VITHNKAGILKLSLRRDGASRDDGGSSAAALACGAHRQLGAPARQLYGHSERSKESDGDAEKDPSTAPAAPLRVTQVWRSAAAQGEPSL